MSRLRPLTAFRLSTLRHSLAACVLASLVVAVIGGCGDESGRAPAGRAPVKPVMAPPKTNWTSDEMAADPEGYLQWADQNLAAQIETRRQRIATVTQRVGELEARRTGFGTNLDDVRNIEKRLADALRKAEEEDRLPVRMGGRTFERDKAKAILVELNRLLGERSPLQQTYEDGLARLRQVEAGLAADMTRLTALRDKLAIDLEQVRVSHGVAELEQLRTTEAEISHYAKILGSIAEETAGALPAAPPPVDLEKLLE